MTDSRGEISHRVNFDEPINPGRKVENGEVKTSQELHREKQEITKSGGSIGCFTDASQE